jgi:predicted  nucleic acid-binding Zn-ribbon protein
VRIDRYDFDFNTEIKKPPATNRGPKRKEVTMNTTITENEESVKPLSLMESAAKVCTSPEMRRQMVENALRSMLSNLNDRKEALKIREMELNKDIHHVAELVHKLSKDFSELQSKNREYEDLHNDFEAAKVDYLKGVFNER